MRISLYLLPKKHDGFTAVYNTLYLFPNILVELPNREKNEEIFLLKCLNRLEQFIVIMRKATISGGFYATSWKLS